mgnify:CR=1 FL=1
MLFRNKTKSGSIEKVGLAAIVGCAACCTLPIIATLAGGSLLAGMGAPIGILALIFSLAGLVFLARRRKTEPQGKSCNLGTCCNSPEPTE